MHSFTSLQDRAAVCSSSRMYILFEHTAHTALLLSFLWCSLCANTLCRTQHRHVFPGLSESGTALEHPYAFGCVQQKPDGSHSSLHRYGDHPRPQVCFSCRNAAKTSSAASPDTARPCLPSAARDVVGSLTYTTSGCRHAGNVLVELVRLCC